MNPEELQGLTPGARTFATSTPLGGPPAGSPRIVKRCAKTPRSENIPVPSAVGTAEDWTSNRSGVTRHFQSITILSIWNKLSKMARRGACKLVLRHPNYRSDEALFIHCRSTNGLMYRRPGARSPCPCYAPEDNPGRQRGYLHWIHPHELGREG